MLKRLLLFSLFPIIQSEAQTTHTSTVFNRFINQPAIEWAAYASDSFYFKKALNDYLVCRMEHSEIKASLPISEGTPEINNFKFLPKDSIDNLVLTEGNRRPPTYNEAGELVLFRGNKAPANKSIFNITEVSQILYIEKGELKSYVPFITPTLPLFLSSGEYLGETYYFNTGYNHNRNTKSRRRDRIIFLGESDKQLKVNPVDKSTELKSTFGRNLIESLWPEIEAGRYKLFSIENDKPIKPADLALFSGKEPLLVPIYDSGNVTTIYEYRVDYGTWNVHQISGVEIIQDWYYNETRNIVFNKIKELRLIVKKAAAGDELPPMPVLKVIIQ